MTPTQELVLDCYHSPHLLRSLADKSIPLPEGLERVMRVAAAVDATDSDAVPQDALLREAVTLFVRRVVLVEGADHYRNLGLRFNASANQIDNHYRLLLALLSGGDKSDLLETSQLLGRVSRAYAVLSQPQRRREYDKARFGSLVKDDRGVLQRRMAPLVASSSSAGEVAEPRQLPARESIAASARHMMREKWLHLSNKSLATLSLFAVLVIVAVSPVLTTQFSKFWFPQPAIEGVDHSAAPLDFPARLKTDIVADAGSAAPPHTGTSWITPSGIVEAQSRRLPPSLRADVAEEESVPEVAAVQSDESINVTRTETLPAVRDIKATIASATVARDVVAARAAKPVKQAAKSVVAPVVESRTAAYAEPTVATAALTDTSLIGKMLADGESTVRVVDNVSERRSQVALSMLKVQELNALLAQLSAAYRDGDTQSFMNLFADDAHTNDQMNKRGIGDDYRGLFESTEQREFSIDNLRWQVRGSAAVGEGEFVARVKPKWKTREDIVAGRLKLEVEQRTAGTLITGLYHDYQN